jgi:hypothetical protein
MTNDKKIKMLSRINIILAIAAFLVQFTASAQTIERTIKWKEGLKTYQTMAGTSVKMPVCEGASATERDGFLPHIGENISIGTYGKITATLSNEVYEPVIGTDAAGAKLTDKVDLKVTPGMMRKQPYALIALMPLRRNAATGQIEKLVKYNLQLTVMATKQDRSGPSFAANSVLASGTWYKVSVTGTGVYKLDHDFLKNKCGFDLNNTSFSTIGVFGNGGGMVPDLNAADRLDDLQENPTMIVDNNGNNKVDNDDYILFYAQGPDQWTYNSTTGKFDFSKNLYSDKNFYFITADKGTGKRITATPSATGATTTITQFDDRAAHQEDKYNLLNSGKQWLGNKMSSLNPSTTINFSFPNLVTSSVAAYSPYNSTIAVSSGGQQLFSQVVNYVYTNTSYIDAFHTSDAVGTFTASNDAVNLTYTYNNPDASGTSIGYIYRVVLNAQRALTFTGGAMSFRSIASVSPGAVSQFNIANATSGLRVWDVTDITAIREISGTLSGGTYSFAANTSTLREFLAVDVNASYTAPAEEEKVENQNLHAMGQPQMVIVTSDELLAAANDLAAFHSQHDHLTVKVFRLKQIYNEFSSGRLDISAIRDMMRMLYTRAGSDSTLTPQYLLLFGDGSFDPKDRTADNNNQVPTYQSWDSQNILDAYTTDDFFGCLDDAEGGDMGSPQLMDISIGRLPAATASEAQGMVDKIKLYKSSAALGSWRNIVTFVSDEPYDGGTEFESSVENFAEEIRLNFPTPNVEKIITDAFQGLPTPGGLRYPDCNTAILNRINNGTLILSYSGHGGISNWSNGRIFNISDIQNLENKEKLPLFVTATCDFSRFDDPTKKTAGEYLMTNSKGGAIAMITTVRPVYLDANDQLQGHLNPTLFGLYHGRRPTVGELTLMTKNTTIQSDSYATKNTRMFVLLGDPAMTLNYPEFEVVTTKIDSVPISQPHDTLKALKYVTISGEIRNANGVKNTSFNGTCYPLVYDKLGTFKALKNKPTYGDMTFNAYKSILFKGQCSVVNGSFTFSFIVPKDINYAIGKGRISYYAHSDWRCVRYSTG